MYNAQRKEMVSKRRIHGSVSAFLYMPVNDGVLASAADCTFLYAEMFDCRAMWAFLVSIVGACVSGRVNMSTMPTAPNQSTT